MVEQQRGDDAVEARVAEWELLGAGVDELDALAGQSLAGAGEDALVAVEAGDRRPGRRLDELLGQRSGAAADLEDAGAGAEPGDHLRGEPRRKMPSRIVSRTTVS